MEETPEWVEETQRTLGSVVMKPKLVTKYLIKPPFRFLHDVICEFLRIKDFGRGLFSPEELNADLAGGDKNSKIDFLTKLINFVFFCSPVEELVFLAPAKIVAGLEPEKTNFLLVKLFQAEKDFSEISSSAVSRVLSGEIARFPETKPQKTPAAPPARLAAAAPPAAAAAPPAAAPSAPTASPARLAAAPPAAPTPERLASQARPPSASDRPRTATKRPPAVVASVLEISDGAAPAIVAEGEAPGEDGGPRVFSGGRPESVGAAENHGKLVQDLLAGKEVKKGRTSIDSDKAREMIQSILQTVAPMSKLSEFFNFDQTLIVRDIEESKGDYQRASVRLATEQQTMADALAPLKRQLEDSDRQIVQLHKEIDETRKRILVREAQINKTLETMVCGK